MKKIVESNFTSLDAFQVTQYIRGRLYILVDFVLGSNSYDEEQIVVINEFLKAYIDFAIAYIKKIPELIPKVRFISLTLGRSRSQSQP